MKIVPDVDSSPRVVLIGGTSHVGKSTLSESLAARLGWTRISTDTLARHPGRPWKPAPEKVPDHVAEHYLSLSVNELIEDVPRVGFIVTNMSAGPEGVVHFYNGRGTAEQWIKEGKYALNWTWLSCHRFVANQVRLALFILAYNLGTCCAGYACPGRSSTGRCEASRSNLSR